MKRLQAHCFIATDGEAALSIVELDAQGNITEIDDLYPFRDDVLTLTPTQQAELLEKNGYRFVESIPNGEDEAGWIVAVSTQLN